ncbi:MAG: hypothetical protein KCHDKBKB_03007 [Elusimicrobia bacterium]|nr:hypothetical protein [Elusimicrobiota bacterium]
MYSPTIYQGAVGTFNVSELAETGVLTTSVSFTIDSERRETKAHISAAALDQIVRTRQITRGLIIDFEGEVIPDANGNASGMAKVFAGQNIATCAHFAAAITEPNGDVITPAVERLGFTRDPAKLLQVDAPTLALSPETAATIQFQAKYYPCIAHDPASAA